MIRWCGEDFTDTSRGSNPIALFWRRDLVEFGSWAPSEWIESPRLKQIWLKERFGDEKQAALYSALTEDYEYDE